MARVARSLAIVALVAGSMVTSGVLAGCAAPTLRTPDDLGDATMPPLLAGLDLASVGIGSRVLAVGIADTASARSRGLVGIDDLGPLDGLLFVYPGPVERSFYMRGVRIPLDIAFVGADRRVLRVLTMPVCAADPCPTYASPGPFQWALESRAGALGDVLVGDPVEIASGFVPE